MTAAASGRAIAVLLVDDQAVVAEAVRRALAGVPGLEFHHCEDAQRAVAEAERAAPTVILQDLVMPGADGLSLVRRYRAHPALKDVPIVVLSSQEEPLVKSDAFAAGASDYLVKLPDAVELVARIRHHSRGYLNQLERDEAHRALHESQQRLLELNAELQRLSTVDTLTGLSNRRYFDECLRPQWNLAVREQRPFCMLMIDVDDFKRYNDSYGHIAGDGVLRHVAAAIHRTFRRPTDLAARVGGEEFAVILPATAFAAACELAEAVRDGIARLCIPHRAGGVADHVTVSVGGVVAIPQQADAFAPFIEAADRALYEAKRSGRNRVVLRDDEAPRQPS
jgi:two-component system chemotaxis family response regulator WspR